MPSCTYLCCKLTFSSIIKVSTLLIFPHVRVSKKDGMMGVALPLLLFLSYLLQVCLQSSDPLQSCHTFLVAFLVVFMKRNTWFLGIFLHFELHIKVII